ncbi:transcription-repair-coupling factor domain protein [Mycobacterium xenopi 4042]|uniref:Transcription-repair-coupling factor domain protein n=1 Tax=Mycobacterium xenopi 4042 TaxID=1299334 RepID=X8AEH7_MYCXE|nr:transcription-repair-coupling factor domain protein [Mycobacterium xenopi 4042]
MVTATNRAADDLTAELRGVHGDAVALFPSWETLPHERLSPGVDTVGARLMVLRRLAHPDDAWLGPPLRVVVTSARSLLQPMTPRLGDIEPLTLAVGDEVAFEEVITRLVELAYTRADMVGRRGSSRCAGNTRRVSADRRTPGAHRVLGRRGHRDAHVLGRRSALHPRADRDHPGRRGLPGAVAERRRAGTGRQAGW